MLCYPHAFASDPNKFAHGEANNEVDIDKAKDIANDTLTLISIFKDEIENMISLEKYKKQ
ncbi:hypothetical protein CIK99_01575 [Prevotella sp. P5-92]|nr:hypothetical protein CIK99_01575 [Prevotella sp. P5-92]